MANPAAFQESGSGGAVDFRIGADQRAQTNGWRRPTPPAGEDGSIPDLRMTVTDGTSLSGPGVALPLYASTFDIPDSEMG